MENKSEKQTVVGITGSELTEQKINRAINEIKDFLNNYLFVIFKFKIQKKSDLQHFNVKIRDKTINGIGNFAMRSIILKSFKFSEIYWIESSNGWIIFNFKTKSD